MPNTFAYLVLYSWPLIAVVLFAAQPPARALSLAVIVGYLLLPERTGIDLPMIPAINKPVMISVAAMAVVALNREQPMAASTPVPARSWMQLLFFGLIGLTLLTPLLTVLTNGEPVLTGPVYIPGIRLYDAVSIILSTGIMIVPFVLGMRVLGTPAAQTELLRVLVLAGCAYALLVLFEARMSPQLSKWTYGYFPHSWAQHFRGGGFRPVVFLPHGLWLGIFLSMVTLAGCALWRQALRDRVQAAPWLAATIWLAITLILSRNLGATALMILFAPVILFVPLRIQVLTAAVIACMILVYPMLRGAGLIPLDTIHSLARSVSEERAASLNFRLVQEDLLLERANRKPLAGWGTWGRNRVYDPDTGSDLSVTDGLWVMIIGSFGWLGYVARFGMLAAPPILILRRQGAALQPAAAGLSVVTTVALIDLIPNATLTPVTWVVAGALAGHVASNAAPAMDTTKSAITAKHPIWSTVRAHGPLRPVDANAAPSAPLPELSHRHRRVPRL